MISHPHKVIFVHLRRTAGNSIELALGGIELFDRAGNRVTQWNNELHRGRTPYKTDKRGHYLHATAMEIQKDYPGEFQSYFKFSFVRNPWAQMVSLHARLKEEHAHNRRHFERWLGRYKKYVGTIPRHTLYDRSGTLLVDFVGRHEKLNEDFREVQRRASLPDLNLTHTNASLEINYQDMYTDAGRAIVARAFAEDIELYGYRFRE